MSIVPTSGFGYPAGTIVIAGFGSQTILTGTSTIDNVTNFTITRGFEGPQLVLSWEVPALPFDELILMRKRYDFSRSPTDGLVLQTGDFTQYTDTDLVHAEYFYYTIFVRRGTVFFVSVVESNKKAIGFSTGDSLAHLLDCLANVHKILYHQL